jgi:membrane protein YqaA with SNARE-associated domain
MSPLATFFATLGVCALSAVVPFVNAELYLVAASALAPRGLVVPLIVAGAVGQMIGKTVMYYAGRGAVRLPSERLRKGIATVREKYGDRRALGDPIVFTSASLGFPPFYIVSVACGLLRVNVVRFIILGLVGRLIRFSIIVLAPQLIKGGLHG